jgi:hypothetical protein
MNDRIFLATTGNGVARAEKNSNGDWSVENLLVDQKVSCFATDPSSPKTVYAGTDKRGVLRSEDRGLTWVQMGLQGEIVKSLAVSPHDPKLIYAGTKPAEIFVSRDGGKSWEELTGFKRIPFRWWWFSPAEPPDKRPYVQAISVSPTESEVVLAGVEFGAVVRSQDGGETWSRHLSGTLRDCHALTFHPVNGDWAYEAGGTGGGASFSRDGGRTWQKSKRGLAKNYGVTCAIDPIKPEVWYISIAPSPYKVFSENPEAYLYRSAGGAEWHPIGWQPHPMNKMPIALVTDPQEPGHLYAGLTNGGVRFSQDYGDTWEKLPFDLGVIYRTMIVI